MKELFYDNLYLSLNISPIQKCTVLYIGNTYHNNNWVMQLMIFGTATPLCNIIFFFFHIVVQGISNAISILIPLCYLPSKSPLVEVDVGEGCEAII